MAIAIYHRVMKREGLEETARILIELLKDSQESNPGEPRHLYLDICGHRNEVGGFDSEMMELQKEFILGFLLRFFEEVHMPLLSVSNPNEQDNDVPQELLIVNSNAPGNDELAALYIENYSNTEFASEEDVHDYLREVRAFLLEVQAVHPMRRLKDENGIPNWRFYWHGYLIDLITELFNGFVLGNLLAVSAMTRTLIESYAYTKLFDQDPGGELLRRWYATNALSTARAALRQGSDRGVQLVKEYCQAEGLSYEEIKKARSKEGENAWLSPVIKKKRISFRDICDYLGEPSLYDDFQQACSYVHGQDLATKGSPFTLYSTIYGKLYLMIDYMLKVVSLLLPLEAEIIEQSDDIRESLFLLGNKYVLQDEK